MKKRYCVLATCVFNLAALCAGENSGDWISQRRKVIAAGWDIGNTTIESFASESNKFAQLPLDGLRFALYAKTKDGKEVVASPSKAMDGVDWDVGIFDDQLDAARAIRLRELPLRNSANLQRLMQSSPQSTQQRNAVQPQRRSARQQRLIRLAVKSRRQHVLRLRQLRKIPSTPTHRRWYVSYSAEA